MDGTLPLCDARTEYCCSDQREGTDMEKRRPVDGCSATYLTEEEDRIMHGICPSQEAGPLLASEYDRTVRVFLVDDHPMFRAGVRVTLEHAGLQVVGEARSWEEAEQVLQQLESPVDVVLTDLKLSSYSGIRAIRAFTSAAPWHMKSARVLVVSMCDDDDAVVAALRAGARGYLLKAASDRELLRAIYTVADGGAVFSAVLAARLSAYFSAVHELPSRVAFPHLTNRERQILDLIARGYSNRHIARELVLSEKTIRNHI